ncbi:MAG TPA: cytochrome c oxidase assembly protein [Acidimicrobiales bacterium]|nr:cytochrome c oxidase assembly protein [Acidimicrobiales bacterium]
MLLADAISPSVSVHTLLTGWQTDTLSLVALAVELALAVWYLVSVRRLAARGRSWPTARTVCFLAATALVVIAVQSGLAAYDDQVFWVHVTQHLLLMNFAPILFALSAPVTLALQASDRQTQRVLLAVLHNPVVEFLTSPIVVVVAAYGTMLVYFLSPFYNFSLEHPLIHDLTHLHFLVSGCLFWWLVVGRDPSRWRLSYPAKLGFLAVGIPINAILGVALTGATTSIAPHFHTLGDTHVGGSVLWVVGELTSLIAMGIVLYQWMQYEEREAVRADRRSDAAGLTGAVRGAEAAATAVSPTHNGSSGRSADR